MRISLITSILYVFFQDLVGSRIGVKVNIAAMILVTFSQPCFAVRETALLTGPWNYGSSTCDDYTHWGFADYMSSALDEMYRKYNQCGDAHFISQVDFVPQPPIYTGGVCSMQYYPVNSFGVEIYNIHKSGVEYCVTETSASTGPVYTFRARTTYCPDGFQFSTASGKCYEIPGQVTTEKNFCLRCTIESFLNSLFGDPIDIAIGNERRTDTDYRAKGNTLLSFSRRYNSANKRDAYLGHGWRSNFDRTVDLSESPAITTAWVHLRDGSSYAFNLNNGAWIPDPDIKISLARLTDGQGNPDGWKLTDKNETVETYNVNGQLTKIEERSGYSVTLNYPSTDSPLDSVTDNYGRTLTFSYNSQGRLDKMVDPAGGVYTYAYDYNQNLTSVTYPDNTPDPSDNPKIIYHYEDPLHVNALTGITDENGDRHATVAYDDNGLPFLRNMRVMNTLV